MPRLAGFDTACRWVYTAPLMALVIALMFSAPSALQAQFNSVIDGRVSDPSDSAVPNAEVTVANLATGVKRVVRTSDVGYYRVASLSPGQYSISVMAPGFDTAVFERVLLENDQTKTFNLPMKVGAPATVVNVTGEVPLVETGEAKISGHIQERQVTQLPLVGRNFTTKVIKFLPTKGNWVTCLSWMCPEIFASPVSTNGTSPVTLTTVAGAPTFIGRLKVLVWSFSSKTRSNTAVSNPGAITLIEYWPGESDATR